MFEYIGTWEEETTETGQSLDGLALGSLNVAVGAGGTVVTEERPDSIIPFRGSGWPPNAPPASATVAHLPTRLQGWHMQVTFLGTGAAMPTGERNQTGLLLEDPGGDADPLLIDCGSGAMHGLAATDVGYEGIGTVLLTHHHLDHVSDLLPLLKARWLAGETDLEILGPDGTGALVEGLLSVHDYMAGRFDLSIREVSPGSFSAAGYDVAAVETVHSMYCLAYRLEADDATFTFSADTEATEAVADLADGSALLAHDCSFPDDIDVDNHPTPTQLGETLAGRDLGRVYLTHLYPHTDGEHESMVEAVGGRVDADVRVARDGLTVDVSRRPS
jgi:ribonuclease BN (tRNA processing enzyme)